MYFRSGRYDLRIKGNVLVAISESCIAARLINLSLAGRRCRRLSLVIDDAP